MKTQKNFKNQISDPSFASLVQSPSYSHTSYTFPPPTLTSISSIFSLSLLSLTTSMAILDLNPQNDNKENVSPSDMSTISSKPLDSSTIDKDKNQIRIRRKRSRKPLQDITNLFVSSSPLIRHVPSSPSLSLDPKCMKRRSGLGLKAAATSSTFSCKNFR